MKEECVLLFWKRRKIEPAPQRVEEKYTYRLLQESNAEDGSQLFELYYSDETGDLDFARICTEILSELLSPFWVNMWLGVPQTSNYLLPDGQRSRGNEPFSKAFAGYLQRSGERAAVLLDKKSREMMTFSNGVYLPALSSYLSDISPQFPVRWMTLYGYTTRFAPAKTFKKEAEQIEKNTWDIKVRYEECRDHMTIEVKSSANCDVEETCRLIETVCRRYGKTFCVDRR